MKKIGKFSLSIFATSALATLMSCTAKPNPPRQPVVLSSTPLPHSSPTLIFPTATYTPTPTSIPSAINLQSPTQSTYSIPSGRILFEGIAIKDGHRTSGINLLALDTNETTQLVEAEQEVNNQRVTLLYPNPTWSPDGHWVALIGTDIRADVWIYGYQDIFIVKADESLIHRLTYSPQYEKHDIAWSPDGNTILVAMGKNGASDLYLINASNGEITKRLTYTGRVYTAAWSPDGSKIALNEGSDFSILSIANETKQWFEVPSNGRIKDISWSSNNEQVAFVASVNDKNCEDIFITNINTGGTINITSSIYYESSPSWLPDGKHLAFSRSTTSCNEPPGQGLWDIFITNQLRDEHKVLSNIGYFSSVAWAPIPSLVINEKYTITELGAFLNLRTEPSLNGEILIKLPVGEIITVIDGYVDIDNYYWWKIRTQEGIEGWIVEVANWYKQVTE